MVISTSVNFELLVSHIIIRIILDAITPSVRIIGLNKRGWIVYESFSQMITKNEVL